MQSVDVFLNTTIRNDYRASFFTPNSNTTVTLATSLDPNQNVGGPAVVVNAPDGQPIFSAQVTGQPPVVKTITAKTGDYASDNPNILPGSPFYIAPTITSNTFGPVTYRPGDPLFSQFIGQAGNPGTISLPVIAKANSSAVVNSGNGLGTVLTAADAIVTLQYHHAPEPSSVVLLLLGGASMFLIGRSRRRSMRAQADLS